MIPYEWVDRRGEGVLSDWQLQPRQRRQLAALLLNLEAFDFEMARNTLIFKKGARDIYYSKINGNEALRPRCCVGPELGKKEYEELRRARAEAGEDAPPEQAMFPAGKTEIVTYLERVSKKDGEEQPLLKDSKASERLREIQEDRRRRQRVTRHRTGGHSW